MWLLMDRFILKPQGTEDHRTLGHGPVRTLGGTKTEGQRKLE
jgi:hypothetical protein